MDFKPFKIGKYVLLERLAMGGMAEVYRAKASGAGGFEKQLAIKRILPNYSQNDEFRRMFEYEARLSSMLTHANIVQIYDFVKNKDTYLLAMEYVDGKNLRQFINKVKKLGFQLPVEYGVYIINEVSKGLEYAHKKRDDVTGRPLNIIHRDMSPQNVMMSYDGAVKIVDFGIAKAKDRVDETRSGVIKGKFGYMSPEQANGEPVDHRTDIFSTGIILYELLTGRRLFSADNDMATLKLIQECVVPPPSKFNPKISVELEKIILKALTKDLNIRYQTAGAFNRQLQEFLAKYYASFGQKDIHESFSKVFKDEITQEKRRFEEAYRQAIPFSQGAQKDDDDDDDNGDSESGEEPEGSITSGDKREKTGVTGSGISHISESDEGNNPNPEPTVVSQSFELTSPSEPAQMGTSAKSEHTQVETPLEGSSLSTLGKDISWSPKKSEDTQISQADKTVFDATNADEEVLITPTEAKTEPRTSEKKSKTSNPSSGIELSQSTNNNRRERSVSFMNRVGKKESTDSDIIPSSDASQATRKRPTGLIFEKAQKKNEQFNVQSQRLSNYDDPEEVSENRGFLPLVRTLVSLVLLLGVAAMTFSFYKSYLKGEIPLVLRAWLPKVSPHRVTSSKVPSRLPDSRPADPEPKSTIDCNLKVESDPASAIVVVGAEEKGTTPLNLPLECGANANITLKKEGYEPVSENVMVKKLNQSLFKQLKRIPVGTLVVSVSLNATVSIPEIKFERYVRLNERVDVTLPAGRKFKIRFLNPVYGLDMTQEVLLQPDERFEKHFRLNENK